jgi:hypothetical protein
MRADNSPWQFDKYLLLLTLVFFASVSPFWGVSRDFHDGTIGEWAYSTGKIEGLKYWLQTSNWWGHYALYAFCMFFSELTNWPVWIFIKLWVTLGIAGLCFEAYKLSRIYSFTKNQAIWVACLVASFPAFATLYSSAVMHFGFVWLGFLAHRWLFWSTGWRNGAACLITLIAFQVNSMLVVLCALAIVAWYLQRRNRKTTVYFALTIILAVLYYALVAFVYPPTGEFVGYNKILWPTNIDNIRKLAIGFAMFGTWAAVWLPAMVLFLCIWSFARSTRSLQVPAPASNSNSCSSAVLIGLILVFAAIFPYAATGKGAPLFLIGAPLTSSAMWAMYASTGETYHLTLDAFMIRQATTMAIPFAILSVACVRWVSLRLSNARQGQFFSHLAASLLSTQLVLLMWGHVAKWNYAKWDASIVAALRTIPPPASGKVEIDLSPNRPHPYPIAESNHLMWMAYGRTQWDTAIYYRNDSTWKKLVLDDRSTYSKKISNKPDQAIKEYFLVDGYDSERTNCYTHISITVPHSNFYFLSQLDQLLDKNIQTASVDRLFESCKR